MYLTVQTYCYVNHCQLDEVEIVLFAIDYNSKTLLFEKYS